MAAVAGSPFCSNAGWKVQSYVPPPIPPDPSTRVATGWYVINFSFSGTQKSIVANTPTIMLDTTDSRTAFEFLWFYNGDNMTLHNFYGSHNVLQIKDCTLATNMFLLVPYNQQLPIDSLQFILTRNSLYHSKCQLFAVPATNQLQITTTATDPNANNWAIFDGTLDVCGYGNLLPDAKMFQFFTPYDNTKALWFDPSAMILNFQPVQSNMIWMYKSIVLPTSGIVFNQIFTFVNGKQYWWGEPSIAQSACFDTAVTISVVTDFTKAQSWQLPVAGDNTGLKTFPYINDIKNRVQAAYTIDNLGNFQCYLCQLMDSQQKLYYKQIDLPPPPTSINSGLYMVQYGTQCLNSNGEMGNCSSPDSVWNYDSTKNTLTTYSDNTKCLMNSMDSNCSGDSTLTIGACNTTQSNRFILASNQL